VLDDGVPFHTDGRLQLPLLVQLVTHPLDDHVAAAELAGRAVESIDRCVQGVLVGELEFLGDRCVDWQSCEPHDRRQQERLEEGQHDDAAGDQHHEVPVGKRSSRVKRVRHGEDRC
jgi:hypothetical protein